ncbi:GAF and ANTAR domain-containing protein [Marmoricola sp. RAF53]|uniref:GAF and ANTAR domain-containing protein n=1 Tax=Marmoricola sp. RAF53 TaxID=3233059 RepID=UPI003F97C189
MPDLSRGPAEDFAEMALRLHDEPGVEETVDLVLEYALKAVGCDFAGVIFVHGGTQVETIAATDPLVERLDEIQMEHGEGPDLDTLEDRLSIIVDDTATETRWPGWAARVASAGIRSLLSTRLYTAGTVIGTLNLYSVKPRQFDVDDQEVAHILARHAAVAIGTARKEENLWQAVDARKLIGQAQGILMERFDLTSDQAFAVLLRYSQDNNIKLRKVAERLVETRRLPS